MFIHCILATQSTGRKHLKFFYTHRGVQAGSAENSIRAEWQQMDQDGNILNSSKTSRTDVGKMKKSKRTKEQTVGQATQQFTAKGKSSEVNFPSVVNCRLQRCCLGITWPIEQCWNF